MIRTLYSLCLLFTTQTLSSVLELDSYNFNSTISNNPRTIALFYAKWCGHSQKLLPEFDIASEEKFSKDVAFVKIEGSIYEELSERFNIQGFPQMLYIEKEDVIRYNSDRNSQAIIPFLHRVINPQIRNLNLELETDLRLRTSKDALINKVTDEARITAFFAVKDSEDEMIVKLAKYVDGVQFVKFIDEGDAIPSLKVYKNFDDRLVQYTGNFTFEEIQKFLEREKLPALLPMDRSSLEIIFNHPSLAVILIRDSKHRRFDREMQFIGTELKQDAHLLICDIGTYYGSQVKSLLKIREDSLPSLRLVKTSGSSQNITQYELSDPITYRNIINFVQKYKEGKLMRWGRSQKVPEKDKEIEGYLKIAVGKNFRDIVYNPSKDVLVIFYAPWETYSREALPEFDALAHHLRVVPTLEFVKIDADANELFEDSVRGFPTIRLYTMRAKDKPITYIGEKKLRPMTEFLMNHVDLQQMILKDEL